MMIDVDICWHVLIYVDIWWYMMILYVHIWHYIVTSFHTTQVDLEDRQMALMYKRLRSASSSEWIQRRLSPSEPVEVSTERPRAEHHWGGRTWCDPTKVGSQFGAGNVCPQKARDLRNERGILDTTMYTEVCAWISKYVYIYIYLRIYVYV